MLIEVHGGEILLLTIDAQVSFPIEENWHAAATTRVAIGSLRSNVRTPRNVKLSPPSGPMRMTLLKQMHRMSELPAVYVGDHSYFAMDSSAAGIPTARIYGSGTGPISIVIGDEGREEFIADLLGVPPQSVRGGNK